MAVEIARELEMHPVVHRVADGFRHHLGELLEAIAPRRPPARDEAFLDAVRAHEAPFVMIVREPRLREVAIAPVLRNLARMDVRMEVKNRHLLRMLVKEPPRRLGLQQKIFIHEPFHDEKPPLPFSRSRSLFFVYVFAVRLADSC